MEFLLLWVDELDDLVGALRHLAPAVLSFLVAIALLVGSAAALVRMPQSLLPVLALAVGASLLEAVRRRRARLAASGPVIR